MTQEHDDGTQGTNGQAANAPAISTAGTPQDKSIWLDRAAAMKTAMCLVGLEKSRWGLSRSLRDDQTATAAAAFGAKPKTLSSRKRILDPKRPSVKKVHAVLNLARGTWESSTYWWNEDGWRMIRKDGVAPLSAALDDLTSKLDAAVEELIADLPAAIEEAKADLSGLFAASDYPTPEEIRSSYRIGYAFRTLEAAAFLRDISPQLAEAEEARIAGQVAVAVAETEAEFYEELAGTVEHLIERLEPGEDGKAKTIQKRNVEAFETLFAKFEAMKLPGERTAKVEELMAKAKAAVSGVDVETLKGTDGAAGRAALKATMAAVKAAIDGSVIDRPRRKFRTLDEAIADSVL